MNLLKDIHRIVTQRQQTSGSGIVTATDRWGVRVGRYDPSTNRTYDRYGRLVGSGNLLASLT